MSGAKFFHRQRVKATHKEKHCRDGAKLWDHKKYTPEYIRGIRFAVAIEILWEGRKSLIMNLIGGVFFRQRPSRFHSLHFYRKAVISGPGAETAFHVDENLVPSIL